MRQSLDRTELSMEGDPMLSFLSQSLKTQQQKVHEVHAKLSEAGVGYDDFLILSETDLRSGLKECSISSFFIGRIIAGLRNIEGSFIYKESRNTKFVKIYVTPQETQAFEKLSGAFKTTSDAVARIQDTITKLEANRQSTMKSIEATFNDLHRDLDRRKTALNKQTNDVAQKKKNVLNQQLDNLTNYRTSLQAVQLNIMFCVTYNFYLESRPYFAKFRETVTFRE